MYKFYILIYVKMTNSEMLDDRKSELYSVEEDLENLKKEIPHPSKWGKGSVEIIKASGNVKYEEYKKTFRIFVDKWLQVGKFEWKKKEKFINDSWKFLETAHNFAKLEKDQNKLNVAMKKAYDSFLKNRKGEFGNDSDRFVAEFIGDFKGYCKDVKIYESYREALNAFTGEWLHKGRFQWKKRKDFIEDSWQLFEALLNFQEWKGNGDVSAEMKKNSDLFLKKWKGEFGNDSDKFEENLGTITFLSMVSAYH